MSDNLIERAREFLAREGYLGGIPASAVAAFTRSVLNDWKVIEVDGLPEEAGYYLVSVLDQINHDPQDAQVMFFIECLDQWDCNSEAIQVIAWQELPPPYRKETER